MLHAVTLTLSLPLPLPNPHTAHTKYSGKNHKKKNKQQKAVDSEVSHSSLTKVICTVGVKSRSVPELVALLEAGMNVARFDFSWGSLAYHTKTLENLREAMKQTKILCATMLDTRGPEIGQGGGWFFFWGGGRSVHISRVVPPAVRRQPASVSSTLVCFKNMYITTTV